MTPENVTLLWHGAAHYHILYKDLLIVVDPLYTRLPGENPHLPVKKEDLEKVDCLLLTHGHLDHSCDFPFLVAKHNPLAYAPAACLRGQSRRWGQSPARRDLKDAARNSWYSPHLHELEKMLGVPFEIGGISITPYQIGTEQIDFWFLREMFIRPWKHGRPAAVAAGLRWLGCHLSGNCFAYLFSFPPKNTTMLYFGNLTQHVDDLEAIERVDVLAIPYCPSNNKWLRDTEFLINRFRPAVALIHHFDNFMNPFTLYRYMNLDEYRAAVHKRCPSARLFFSKFYKEVELREILEA